MKATSIAEYLIQRLHETKYNYNLRKLFYDINDVNIDRPIFLQYNIKNNIY